MLVGERLWRRVSDLDFLVDAAVIDDENRDLAFNSTHPQIDLPAAARRARVRLGDPPTSPIEG